MPGSIRTTVVILRRRVGDRVVEEISHSGHDLAAIGEDLYIIDRSDPDLDSLVDGTGTHGFDGLVENAHDRLRVELTVEGLSLSQLQHISDEVTDPLTSELFSAVTARQDAIGLEATVRLFYIGRFFERIADHGVNIARNITFVVTARFPEND